MSTNIDNQGATAMDTTLQTRTLAEGNRVSTTYTRADLGIETAMIFRTPGGRWVARLYYGPEDDEHTSETFDLESTADRAATEHSLSF